MIVTVFFRYSLRNVFRMRFMLMEYSNNKHGDFVQQLVGSNFTITIFPDSAVCNDLANMWTSTSIKHMLTQSIVSLIDLFGLARNRNSERNVDIICSGTRFSTILTTVRFLIIVISYYFVSGVPLTLYSMVWVVLWTQCLPCVSYWLLNTSWVYC